MKRFKACLAAVLLIPSLAYVDLTAAGSAQPHFAELLNEAGLQFNLPDGFFATPLHNNPLLPYEHAIQSRNGKVEIRYAVRPLSRITIDYQDPHSAAPEPNHLFPLMFQSITQKLASGGHTPSNEYPTQQARQLFNADWAAAAVFDINPTFTTQFSQGLLIAMHKNDQADAYIICLFDEYAPVKHLLDAGIAALVFESAPH